MRHYCDAYNIKMVNKRKQYTPKRWKRPPLRRKRREILLNRRNNRNKALIATLNWYEKHGQHDTSRKVTQLYQDVFGPYGDPWTYTDNQLNTIRAFRQADVRKYRREILDHFLNPRKYKHLWDSSLQEKKDMFKLNIDELKAHDSNVALRDEIEAMNDLMDIYQLDD